MTPANRFYMEQQQFVEQLLETPGTLSMAVIMWSMGPLSRRDRRMFPTLKAMMIFKSEQGLS